MEAKELRIGNWINVTFSHIVKQQVVDCMCDSVNTKCHESLPFDLIEPIPLTEEWLLKFGFIKRNEYEFDFWQNSMWKLKEYKNKKYYILFHCSDEVDCTLIKYVHSLQNLYFALTGQELQIKA